jgi:hypothetical protein
VHPDKPGNTPGKQFLDSGDQAFAAGDHNFQLARFLVEVLHHQIKCFGQVAMEMAAVKDPYGIPRLLPEVNGIPGRDKPALLQVAAHVLRSFFRDAPFAVPVVHH